MNRSALALLSGGLDSAVALGAALQRYRFFKALFFDYGQRAARREETAARAIGRYYRIPFQKVVLPWLAKITPTALVSRERRLPCLSSNELDQRQQTRASALAVWVPNRNGVFINIAASFAESAEAKIIITGFDWEEAQAFPDNSIPFIRAVNRALAFSTLNHIRVESPVARLDKVEIVRLGIKLKVPLHLTWSCYEGKQLPCGVCESCQRARRAFRQTRYDEKHFSR